MFGKRTQLVLRDVENAKVFFESLMAPITSGTSIAADLRAEAETIEKSVDGLKKAIQDFATGITGKTETA